MFAKNIETKQAELREWTKEEKKEFNRIYHAPYGEEGAVKKDSLRISENIAIVWNDGKVGKNSHILALGSPASGKTRSVVLPNLLKASGSYIVVDPDGSLYKASKEKLSENGYRINVLDISDPKHSEKYNPLRYINSDEDIKALVTCILKNTNSGENKDLLFENAESSLLQAVFFYMTRHCEIEKRTLREAYNLCTAALDRREEFDALFDVLRKSAAFDPTVKCHDDFRSLPEQTAASVCMAAACCLKDFNVEPEADISSEDGININHIADTKTAVFLTGSNTSVKQSVLIPIFCMQAFRVLMHHAEYDFVHCVLPEHVTLLLDELPNIGYISELCQYITTCGSYGISVIMAAQTVNQLKYLYHETADEIVNKCAAIVLLNAGESMIESIGRNLPKDTLKQLPDNHCLVFMQDMPVTVDEKIRENI